MSDETRKRIRLPSSGLAEEILDAYRRGELDAPDDEPPAGGAGNEPTAASIYSFTDSLQIGEEDEEERETWETWVVFELAEQSFALPVSHVQEILRPPETTPVPGAPFPVRGVFNLRGRVVPILALGGRLGFEPKEPDADSRVLVVESRGRRIGLLVDGVQRVARLGQSTIEPAPPGHSLAAMLRGCTEAGAELLLLLDPDAAVALPAPETDS